MKKGMALIWSIILLSIMAILSVSIANYMIKDNRFTLNIQASSQAYSSAKTGIEWANSLDTSGWSNNTTNSYTFNDIEGYDVYVTIHKQNHLLTQIKSQASNGSLRRTLEGTIRKPNEAKVNNNFTSSTAGPHFDATNGSFVLRFNFWLVDSTSSGPIFHYGVADESGRRLVVRIDSNLGSESAKITYLPHAFPDNTGAVHSTLALDLDTGSGPANAYKYFAELSYLPETNAVLKIEKRDIVTGLNACEKIISLDMTNKPLINVNKFFVYPNAVNTVGLSDPNNDINGAMKFLAPGGNYLYIDNISAIGLNSIISPPPPPPPPPPVPSFSSSGGGTWSYKRQFTINNLSGAAVTDYQFKVTLTTATLGNPYGNIKADGSDIRFANSTGAVEYPYWIESWNPNGNSIIWVKVTENVPNGTNNNFLSMYYGNSSAVFGGLYANYANGTFDFFENFESYSNGQLNPGGWALDTTGSLTSNIGGPGSTFTIKAASKAGSMNLQVEGGDGTCDTAAEFRTFAKKTLNLPNRMYNISYKYIPMYQTYDSQVYIKTRNNLGWIQNLPSPESGYGISSLWNNNIYTNHSVTFTSDYTYLSFGTIFNPLSCGSPTVVFDNIIIRKASSVEPTVSAPGSQMSA